MPKIFFRIPTIFAGIIFLLAGIGKLNNVVGFQYLIIEYGFSSLNLIAPFIILLEVMIGSCLLLGMHTRTTSIFAIILLLSFTCAYNYAYLTHNITDCGCFGNLPIISTPIMVNVRNFILLVLLIITIVFDIDNQQKNNWKIYTLGTILLSATFVAGMSYKPFAFTSVTHPYENNVITNTPLYTFKAAQCEKSELLFFFSYSCPHCINSIENLKAWEETKAIDKLSAYVVVDSQNIQIDSLRRLFQMRFPTVKAKEINKDRAKFIEAYPSTFIIKNDTIKNIIIGELPSPYLYQQ